MTDKLIFLNQSGQKVYIAGWIGPWPPPSKLSVMKGKQSGIVAVVEEGRAPAQTVEQARRLGSIEETRYRLRNASTLPEPAGPGEHWFRGAEYVPDGDDA